MGVTRTGDTAPEMERPRGPVSDASPVVDTGIGSSGFSCFSHATPHRSTESQWERPAEERRRVREMTHAIEERARESSAEAARQHVSPQRSEMGVDLLGMSILAPVTPTAGATMTSPATPGVVNARPMVVKGTTSRARIRAERRVDGTSEIPGCNTMWNICRCYSSG